jgi:hypothetical protein
MTHKPIVAEDVFPATSTPSFDPMDGNSFLYDPDYIDLDIYSARQTSVGGSIITGIPWAETDIDNTYTVDEYTHTRFELTENGGAGCCISGTGTITAPWGIYGSNHKLTKTVVRYPSHTKLYQFCLIFPWWERESYLFQERWVETKDDPVIEYISSKRVLGTSVHTSGSNAGVQDWRLFTEAYYCYSVPAFTKNLGACTESDPDPAAAITDYVPWQSATFYNVTGGGSQCCEDTNQKFVVYAAGSTITIDDVVNDEEELSGAIDTDTGTLKAVTNKKDTVNIIDMESKASTLFASGLYDDLGACSPTNSSPFWFGVWLDAWTGNGWIKHEGYGATDSTIVGATLEQYPMFETLPISVEFSGWFGIPFR